MGRVIQLPQEVDAPGSVGQFSLQVVANCSNPHKQDWNTSEYELVVLVINAGVLVTQQGSSSSFCELLTKSDTLATCRRTRIYYPFAHAETHGRKLFRQS